MKKLIAMLLALVIVLSLAACTPPAETPTDATNAEGELKPVTLTWLVPFDEREGSDDVEEAFNAKLAEALPNTTVEFVYGKGYDFYHDTWTMMLAGEEKMDIAWAGWMMNHPQEVEDGNYLPLTDLVEEYAPNLKEEMSVWANDYASCTYYDGELYMIPSVQPNSGVGSAQLYIHKSIFDYLDAERIAELLHANDKTPNEVFDLITEGIQKAVEAGAIKLGDNSWNIHCYSLFHLAMRGYVRLSSNPMGDAFSNYFIDPEADEVKVYHLFECPGVQYAMQVVKDWVERGWITDSQIAGQLQDGSIKIWEMNPSQNAYWTDLLKDWGLKDATDELRLDNYCILTELPEQVYQPCSTFGYATTNVIPFTAENPERAMMLLDLLHDKETGSVGNELYNLMCYGFAQGSAEAEKYGWYNYAVVKDADGQDMVDTSVRNGADWNHYMDNWAIGNTYKVLHDGGSLTTVSMKEAGLKFWEETYPTMQRSVITGMAFDMSELEDELNATGLVFEEYYRRICWSGDTELVSEMYDKMGTDLNTIKESQEAQIKAYMGS